MAFASCSNYPYGYFNAYGRIAARTDIDLVLHLGDYLYEYGQGEYANPALAGLRDVVPSNEILSLTDYRLRHALYKSDPDLQELHRHLRLGRSRNRQRCVARRRREPQSRERRRRVGRPPPAGGAGVQRVHAQVMMAQLSSTFGRPIRSPRKLRGKLAFVSMLNSRQAQALAKRVRFPT